MKRRCDIKSNSSILVDRGGGGEGVELAFELGSGLRGAEEEIDPEARDNKESVIAFPSSSFFGSITPSFPPSFPP